MCYFGCVGGQLNSTYWGIRWMGGFYWSVFHEMHDDLWRWFKHCEKWIVLDWCVWEKGKFVPMQSEILSVVVLQSHCNYLSDQCSFVNQSNLIFWICISNFWGIVGARYCECWICSYRVWSSLVQIYFTISWNDALMYNMHPQVLRKQTAHFQHNHV